MNENKLYEIKETLRFHLWFCHLCPSSKINCIINLFTQTNKYKDTPITYEWNNISYFIANVR